jgi:peptide/nickel transport system permease protein
LPKESKEARYTGKAKRIWHRFCQHRLAVAGLVVIVLLLLCALLAGVISPFDPYQVSYNMEMPPGNGHLLGTDQVGRDVVSRLIYGARVSLTVGFGTVAFTTVLGSILGLISGWYGGAVDFFIMRVADIFMSFPMLLLIMVINSIIGPGLDRIILIMGILGWPSVARLVRANTLSVRQLDYVRSAVALGFKTGRILFLHILPNIIGPVLVQATFGIAQAIIMESALSFLGLGVNPPTASWGSMLTDAQSLSTLTEKPWLWVPPGIMILLSVLAFNFIGDGLRDALDPNNDR